MTIKVSKPSINIREKLSELEQDTGLKGQELMRSETVAEARTAIGAGRKNLIINGGMDVWQRGTSFIDPSDGYGSYTADRWSTYYASTLTEKQTNTVDGSLMNTLKCSGGSGSFPYIYQKIEQGSKLISGKEVTVSFWYKSTATMILEYRYGTSTVPTSSTMGYSYVDTSIAATSSWVKYTKTFTPVDSSSSVELDRWIGIWFFTLGNTDVIELANVQLELGSVATDFEHRSYGEELALCQRYYETGITEYFGIVSNGNAESVMGYFAVTKRAMPSISLTNNANSSRFNSTPINASGISTGSFLDKRSETGNAGSVYEHSFSTVWTANAEL